MGGASEGQDERLHLSDVQQFLTKRLYLRLHELRLASEVLEHLPGNRVDDI
jgi:hypothetical protein